MKVKRTKPKSSKSSRMTSRQNFKLAKMEKKVQMGRHSGQTARAISRHQMAAAISGNLNTVNVNTNHNANANIQLNNKGSLTSVDDKPKDELKVNDSSDILGWLN